MKLLFLRGQCPTDRPVKEIMHKSLKEEDDMWTELAYHLGDERCEVLYWGGKRNVWYSRHCNVRFTKNFNNYRPDFTPDVIFARGGFNRRYLPILKKYPKAFQIWYGAGARFIPKHHKTLNLILADSPAQLRKLNKKLPRVKASLWFKPAPSFFKPVDVKKKYDVCYIANGTQADIKRIKWVYKTKPKNISMFHLGLPSKYKRPKNTKCKRVTRMHMPKAISRCRVGIVPYKSIDSAPRVISEMFACNVPVVALDSVQIWKEYFPVVFADKANFWNEVREYLKYKEHLVTHGLLALPKAVEYIRGLIDGN